jgi:hypothetical protein
MLLTFMDVQQRSGVSQELQVHRATLEGAPDDAFCKISASMLLVSGLYRTLAHIMQCPCTQPLAVR